jgi:hypothetical protein
VIAEVIKPLSFKVNETNCSSVYYYSHKGVWKHRQMSENWFHKHFGLEDRLSEREKITTESSVAATQCPFSSKRKHTNF